jgi:hypothetical protein
MSCRLRYYSDSNTNNDNNRTGEQIESICENSSTENQPRLFKPFQRMPGDEQRERGGSFARG